MAKKSLEELRKALVQARDELGKLQLELGSKKLKNVHVKKLKRKEIAQILTIIRQKEHEYE